MRSQRPAKSRLLTALLRFSCGPSQTIHEIQSAFRTRSKRSELDSHLNIAAFQEFDDRVLRRLLCGIRHQNKITSRPVSRVLSGCASRRPRIRDGHSSGMSIAGHLKQPTRATGLETDFEPGCPARGRPYLVLLPVGFTVPRPLPARAVRSYRTLSSLLPRPAGRFGGLLSVALSLGLPPAAVSRHRVSMEPGLSSACPARCKQQTAAAAVRPTGLWRIVEPAALVKSNCKNSQTGCHIDGRLSC